MARLLVGGACVTAPGLLLETLGAPDHGDARVRRIARVLGTRLVAQAVVDITGGRRTRTLDVAVELAHAASMLAVSLHWRAHRRSASISAGLATGIAALDLAGGRR
jgi:hypothetical protein